MNEEKFKFMFGIVSILVGLYLLGFAIFFPKSQSLNFYYMDYVMSLIAIVVIIQGIAFIKFRANKFA